jgi:hypothetical protein
MALAESSACPEVASLTGTPARTDGLTVVVPIGAERETIVFGPTLDGAANETRALA